MTILIATDRIKEAFAAKLRVLLKERGMQQADLARALHMTRAAINGWTRGKRFPTIEVAVQIADLLKVSMDELFCTAELRGKRRAQDEHKV